MIAAPLPPSLREVARRAGGSVRPPGGTPSVSEADSSPKEGAKRQADNRIYFLLKPASASMTAFPVGGQPLTQQLAPLQQLPMPRPSNSFPFQP